MTTISLGGLQLIDGLTPNPMPEPIPFPFPFPPDFGIPPFRPIPPIRPFPLPYFKECTPKILVITDGLSFNAGATFGLTEFVDSMRMSAIHGMVPEIITAQYNPNSPGALNYNPATKHITNYKFTDGTHGLLKSRYDVVFILSIHSGNGTLLASEAGALDRIVDFMEAGGGLFCTGDHATLGAGMCANIPRVNKMRKWFNGVPSAGGNDRLTTILPGSNDIYAFSDQSDAFPQRLYANYRSVAGGFDPATPAIGAAHPLLQMPNGNKVIEVFPDHPHEGECLVPTNSGGSLPNGSSEWPSTVLPEMVALIMSHGNGFSSKEAVEPKSFIAVSAYNGHGGNVGRVVADSTWHHFVNVNIKPGMSAISGQDSIDIKQYYANLADWLMPKNVRLCLRYPWVLATISTTSLLEELPIAALSKLTTRDLEQVGISVKSALLRHHTKAQVTTLMQDTLEPSIGSNTFNLLRKESDCNFFETAELIALGTFSIATVERFNELVDKGEITDKADLNGQKAFAGVGEKEVADTIKFYLKEEQENLNKRMKSIDSILK